MAVPTGTAATAPLRLSDRRHRPSAATVVAATSPPSGRAGDRMVSSLRAPRGAGRSWQKRPPSSVDRCVSTRRVPPVGARSPERVRWRRPRVTTCCGSDPLAQWQSSGLLIRWFRVRVPGGSPPICGGYTPKIEGAGNIAGALSRDSTPDFTPKGCSYPVSTVASTASSARAASCSSAGERWAYVFIVRLICECPRMPMIVRGATPPASRRDAAQWRRSWNR